MTKKIKEIQEKQMNIQSHKRLESIQKLINKDMMHHNF